jgi:uncharacterized membrane protein YdjX (TVP38/TMEM64 family)
MKYLKKKRHLFAFSSVILTILMLFSIFFISRNFSDEIIFILNTQPYIGPILLVLWRITGIIVPAIPAGIISFAAVPIFGWFATYIYTVLGILIGTSISFFLARKFREPLVSKFVPLKKLHKLEGELSERKRFVAILLLRLFTVPVMDFSSYAAGLTRISFPKFLLATFLASIPDIAIFYFGEKLYQTFFGRSVIVAVGTLFFLSAGYFIIKRFIIDRNK